MSRRKKGSKTASEDDIDNMPFTESPFDKWFESGRAEMTKNVGRFAAIDSERGILAFSDDAMDLDRRFVGNDPWKVMVTFVSTFDADHSEQLNVETTQEANRSVTMNAKEEMQRAVDEMQKTIRRKQSGQGIDLLREAESAAGSMMEPRIVQAIQHAIGALSGETVDPAGPPMPSLPPWISPYEGEMSRIVSEKVAKAMEALSQFEWVRDLPGKPMEVLGEILKWAIEMCSKADHLEHNDRARLERGREALGEARQYMREALHRLLYDDVTGDIALAYDRATDAVGDALVVLSDNMLRDGRNPQRRPIRRVTSRRDAALLAHALLSEWLRAEVEAPFGDDGRRRREFPAAATAAMYRAAYLVGACVLREDAGRSPASLASLARSAVGFVRERITRWPRATIR